MRSRFGEKSHYHGFGAGRLDHRDWRAPGAARAPSPNEPREYAVILLSGFFGHGSVSNHEVVDDARAVNTPDARSYGRCRTGVAAVAKLHGPGVANLIANGNRIAAFRGVDLQEVQFVITGHTAFGNRVPFR